MKSNRKKTKTKVKNWIRFRVFLVLLAFIASFVVITFRAYQLQILQRKKLEGLADRQRQKVATLLPRRGIIYDRHGEELAISIDVDSLYGDPDRLRSNRKLVTDLSRILRMSHKKILRKVNSSKGFVWLKRRLSPDVSSRIIKLNRHEIGLIREKRRYYPNTELAGHLLGFVGLDSQGLEGLELVYDDLLKGKAEEVIMERDALGRTLQIHVDPFHKGAEGHNLVLTIDRSIQYITEQALERAVTKANAKAGMGIVMEPHTGEILAIANRPSFNPNTFWTFRPHQWRNRAVTDSFEPGSTFKIFLAAAALEEEIVQPDTLVFCEYGSLKVRGKTINDHKKYGWLSLKGIIRVSSNIGASKIGMQLGEERLYKYIRKFGFGQKMGIKLPGESSGLVEVGPNRSGKYLLWSRNFDICRSDDHGLFRHSQWGPSHGPERGQGNH
jgi:cell division protein FtsI (penicillin-binding protein 3)